MYNETNKQHINDEINLQMDPNLGFSEGEGE